MKKILPLVAACVFLAGCEDRETARLRNEERLPPGCRIIDMDYGELRAAVVCDGRKTTTQLREWQETVMQANVGANGAVTMTPVTYYHSSMSAVIEQ